MLTWTTKRSGALSDDKLSITVQCVFCEDLADLKGIGLNTEGWSLIGVSRTRIRLPIEDKSNYPDVIANHVCCPACLKGLGFKETIDPDKFYDLDRRFQGGC